MKLEEEVELMDIKAEVLYGQLIEMLGGDIDHEEVNYIIKLVIICLSINTYKTFFFIKYF